MRTLGSLGGEPQSARLGRRTGHVEAPRRGLALGLVKRFVPVGPSSYDDIRRMRDACEAAGFMQLR